MRKSAKTITNILSGKSKKKYKFHFVGIGGVSMSLLALIFKELGQTISGSDTRRSENVKKLISSGVDVCIGHNEKNVVGADFVIYSFAVENNVEVKKAKEIEICTMSRPELLALVLKQYKTSICVAGAHGKTTTTALIYSILKEAGLNPSLHLGGAMSNGESGVFANGGYIVCEACEYKDAFLHFRPSISVVLNTAPEHLDYFKTYDNVKRSFAKFGKNANLLICPQDQSFLTNDNKITFGDNGANFTYKKLRLYKDGTQSFDCFKNNEFYARIHLNLIGRHNVFNALSAISCCDYLGIDKTVIQRALSEFVGVKRRFEVVSKIPPVISDYAHHPDEIGAVLNEFKKFYKGRLLVVFQPHTYSRTRTLLQSFKSVLNDYETVIYKTFSAREKYDEMGSAKRLSITLGDNSSYFKSIKALREHCLSKIKDGYAVIFLGAGDLDRIAKRYFANIQK